MRYADTPPFLCQVCGKPAVWTFTGPPYCSTPKPLITCDDHAPPEAVPSYYRQDK